MIQVPLDGPPWPDLAAVEADLRAHAPHRHPGPGPMAEAWRAAREAWATGHGGALDRALAVLAVDPAGTNALRPVVTARLPSDEDLARVALDRAPNAGEAAPAELLGPLAEALDLRLAPHRRAWAAAVAASAFVLHDDDDRSPMRSFLREARHARSPLRDGFLAVARAPLAPWRIVPVEGGLGVVALLPIAPGARPTGPVPLTKVPGSAAPGRLLVGRLVHVDPHRWEVRTGVVLPLEPSEAEVAAWLRAVEAPLRVAARGLDLDDVLRSAGHRILANACRAAAASGPREAWPA